MQRKAAGLDRNMLRIIEPVAEPQSGARQSVEILRVVAADGRSERRAVKYRRLTTVINAVASDFEVVTSGTESGAPLTRHSR